MNLSDLQSLILQLDQAYGEIIGEYGKSASGPDPSASFYHRGAQSGGPATRATEGCAIHGGALHGLPSDDLSRGIGQELSAWVDYALRSPTARQLLGVDAIDSQAGGARLGALIAQRGEGFDLKMSASGQAVTATSDALWVPNTTRTDVDLWPAAGAAEVPAALATRGDLREAYRASFGPRAALDKLGDCPPPRLIAAALEGSEPALPISYSERWLAPSRGRGAEAWSTPCQACQFGLSRWACGHEEALQQRSADARARYQQTTAEWLDFLKGRGSEQRRKQSAAAPKTAAAVAPTGAVAASPAAASQGAGPAAVAAATSARQPGPAARERGRKPATDWDAVTRASKAEQREHVHIRLFSSAFACDDLELRELHGSETISQLFSFHVLVVCPQSSALTSEEVVGAPVSILFERGGVEVRTVHGMVAQLDDRLETESEWRSYRLWIVPRAWRGTLVSTQEVFQDINVPDLIQQKVALVDAESELKLQGSYPVRELIVQYKENDVAFYSRLAEHLGISFYFDHQSGSDRLVFCDHNQAFPTLERATIEFHPRGERVDVFEIESQSRAFPVGYVMQDYNYRTPTVDLTVSYEHQAGSGGGIVEYGAHYKDPQQGLLLAQVRAEEQAVLNRTFSGKSDVAEMFAGGRFTLSGHPRLEGQELLLVEVEHHAVQTTQIHGGAAEAYHNKFKAVDAALTYRPPRVTPRPRIHGAVTALVEPDPSGQIAELAQIDAEGRYTVQFYFDAGDLKSRTKHSRPVRMLQPHSGPNYGHHFPLKPGVEVLIIFMDGDPDRPLILGAVPNPMTASPVNLEVNLMNRIETASGLIIEMRDAVPPLVK